MLVSRQATWCKGQGHRQTFKVTIGKCCWRGRCDIEWGLLCLFSWCATLKSCASHINCHAAPLHPTVDDGRLSWFIACCMLAVNRCVNAAMWRRLRCSRLWWVECRRSADVVSRLRQILVGDGHWQQRSSVTIHCSFSGLSHRFLNQFNNGVQSSRRKMLLTWWVRPRVETF